MTYTVPKKILPFAVYHFLADYRLRFSWSWLFQQFCSLSTVVVLGALSYSLISHFIFQSVTVSGNSMYPNLFNAGNYWLERYAYLEHKPQRTDIVAVKDPQDGGLIVKRIIGLPGESLFFNNGIVYLNGRRLNEPYLPSRTPTYAYEKSEDELICCGKNQYFVMGDNRNNSCDSRTFGPVPRQDILGKVVE
ncbi:MAG: signal peptidase I [Limisphaerales bacterium]